MKPGKLDEHPMPLIVATSCFGICNSTKAFWTAARTPKSPQPGHQSGSTLPLKSAITIACGVTASVAIFRFSLKRERIGFYAVTFTVQLSSAWCLNHNFVGGYGQLGLACQLLLDRFHYVAGKERLAVILTNIPVGDKA